MATLTPNFSLQKPVPLDPVDENLWGDQLNDNFDTIDTELKKAFVNIASKTANFTATSGEKNYLYLVDATSGTVTATLPAASSGLAYGVKKTDSSTNTVIIDPNGGELIDGANTYTITAQNEAVFFISDGTGWKVRSIYTPPNPLVPSYAEYTANANLNNVIPSDDTIPQITEGTEIVTVSITPRSTDSRIRVRFQGYGASSNGGLIVTALYRDAVANALAASVTTPSGSGSPVQFGIEFEDEPNTTSPVTYRIRIGPTSASYSIRLNGTNSGRLFGGASKATLIAEELPS